MARLPLRFEPVSLTDESDEDVELTAEQQEALFFSRKRRKLRQGFFEPPAE